MRGACPATSMARSAAIMLGTSSEQDNNFTKLSDTSVPAGYV
jgi:hypothetical protein